MTEPIVRFMGVSAIKRGEEAAFLQALAECRGELTELLGELRAGACSLFRQGRYVFLYAEFPDAEAAAMRRRHPQDRQRCIRTRRKCRMGGRPAGCRRAASGANLARRRLEAAACAMAFPA